MSIQESSNFGVHNSVLNDIPGHDNIVITGDYYHQDFSTSRNGLSELRNQVAFNALHDSKARYPQPNVLAGTRKEILERICQWIEDPSKENRVYWVNGTAGAGKSAIAQALSEKYTLARRLAAVFFFSRNDSTRDNLDPFVATLALQLATSDVLQPLLASFIHQTVHSMPEIFHKNWEVQFKRLIEEPCAQVDPRQWPQLPQLVIIDGVDECIEVGSQKRLLRMIQNSTSTLPLDFLIFSRPEPHISRILFHESFTPSPLRLALGDFDVWHDIETYLRHEFARIREEHRNTLPSSQAYWPDDSVIQELLCRATGQFIYATTVMKFIDVGKRPLTPTQRLDVILRATRAGNLSSPYPDLDLLYSQILQYCLNEDGKLQKVLKLIVSPVSEDTYSRSTFTLYGSHYVGWRSCWALEQLLQLNEGEATALVSGLHSILDIPASKTKNITVLHASFSEFLLDQDRAEEYYVGGKASSREWRQLLIPGQIRILSQLCINSKHGIMDYSNGIHNADIGSLNVWEYLFDNQETVTVNAGLAAALNAFDPHLYLATLLCWIISSNNFISMQQIEVSVEQPRRVKYINPAEGNLLCKLLLQLIVDKIDDQLLSQIMRVFVTSDIEDWTYELARLDWEKTQETYLSSGKALQMGLGKRLISILGCVQFA
ncbi:hypothetical protein L218DRAFT_1077858 [Marasmius fiardii PR-910]|nr:hypothetical protein L218DRAFT_1077858 [Marasmius fiardii PR-910]